MNKYYWLNDLSRQFLDKWYLTDWQTAENRIEEIGKEFERRLKINGIGKKFVDYMSKWYYSLATPIWCNYGNNRWLPISCYSSFIEDTMESILYTQWEVGMMSKVWWWTSWYFGKLRPRGSEIKNNWTSSWAVHFMKLFSTMVDVCSQGSSRRWAFTPYLDIDHSDIKEFLRIWTEWDSIQNLTTGICVKDKWLEDMVNGDEDKREIWASILKSRSEVWFPYISFVDNINNNKPECYKDSYIYNQNLCNEIALPTNEKESFVCCLSSINLLHWDKIKDTDAVEILLMFLDTVMSEFIDKLEKFDWDKKYFMKRALEFAKNHRALWLWVLWWHSYLQSNMIPFESEEAKNITENMWITIKDKSHSASKWLWSAFGECKMTKWLGRRNTVMTAIAPTTSSAFILGQVSQSIEPYMSNYYIKDTAKIKYTFRNPYLEQLLNIKWYNNEDVRKSILDNDWSVQHLAFLSKEERNVFKTFGEINQNDIILQAEIRQKHLDQWQSLNVLIPADWSVKQINDLHLSAWKKWIKWLYYQHSYNKAQQVAKDIKCSWCES